MKKRKIGKNENQLKVRCKNQKKAETRPMNEKSENSIINVILTQRDDDGCSRGWRPKETKARGTAIAIF